MHYKCCIIYMHRKCEILIFYISQGSAATQLRRGGQINIGFVGNLVLFAAVKEFWKSIKNWQSYGHDQGPGVQGGTRTAF